jgi:hypothetical protein
VANRNQSRKKQKSVPGLGKKRPKRESRATGARVSAHEVVRTIFLERCNDEKRFFPKECEDGFNNLAKFVDEKCTHVIDQHGVPRTISIFTCLFEIGKRWVQPIKPPGVFSHTKDENYPNPLPLDALKRAYYTVFETAAYLHKASWVSTEIQLKADDAARSCQALRHALIHYESNWRRTRTSEKDGVLTLKELLGSEQVAFKLVREMLTFFTRKKVKLNPSAHKWEKRVNDGLARRTQMLVSNPPSYEHNRYRVFFPGERRSDSKEHQARLRGGPISKVD